MVSLVFVFLIILKVIKVSKQQEYKINELESENRTLKAEVERLKKSLSIYNQTNFSKLDLGEVLPDYLKPQAE